jgi:ubiquinone/menaquinone biosynthesis C-methylase UbiE
LNLLDHDQPFPGNFDVVWMSQLLSCFSQADMTQLLRRSAQALKPGGKLFILETFWDRQKYFGAAYNLQQTSLYFASIANGVSRIYDFDSVGACVREAGLHIQEVVDGLGVGHTLLVCSP